MFDTMKDLENKSSSDSRIWVILSDGTQVDSVVRTTWGGDWVGFNVETNSEERFGTLDIETAGICSK